MTDVARHYSALKRKEDREGDRLCRTAALVALSFSLLGALYFIALFWLSR